MHNLFKKNTSDKKGKNYLAFFSQIHKIAFVISIILLGLALSSAYLAYTEGKSAKINAQQTLAEFEQLVLKKDQSYPHTIYEAQIKMEQTTGSTEAVVVAKPEVVTPIESEPTKVEATEPPNKIQPTHFESVAKIQIEKIGLSVSVLSEWSYELLAISVNKFSGPNPNEPGNFIVIGHNYINKAHFGSLHLVEIGDLIDLTDLTGRTITYVVDEILIIKPTEVEKLATDSSLALTLITCDADSDYRLVVKSKATNSP